GVAVGMMVWLTCVVHRIVRRGSNLVHADNRAVTDGAAIVPCHVRADGNGFDGFLGLCHLYALVRVDATRTLLAGPNPARRPVHAVTAGRALAGKPRGLW